MPRRAGAGARPGECFLRREQKPGWAGLAIVEYKLRPAPSQTLQVLAIPQILPVPSRVCDQAGPACAALPDTAAVTRVQGGWQCQACALLHFDYAPAIPGRGICGTL
jgi:hypothetical protein